MSVMTQLNEIIERINELDKQFKQFNCKHDEITFIYDYFCGSFPYNYRKECTICGKKLQEYNMDDWYKEKVIHEYNIAKKEYDKVTEKTEW